MNTQEKIYRTQSGDIHYWITPGQPNKPCLVFLPGLTADHHLFDRQIPAFPEYSRLVWDAPAHAASRPLSWIFPWMTQPGIFMKFWRWRASNTRY